MSIVRKLYVRWIRSRIAKPINRQRIKLVWFVWGYRSLLSLNLSIGERISLIYRFFLVDWNVLHAHVPVEIAIVCHSLAERRAKKNETMIEAGCFNGGASAKFSIVCHMLGYELHIYDSFEGVEQMSEEESKGTYDFSGEYAVPEQIVRANVTKYGEVEICSFHKGWFCDTLALGVSAPLRIAFIDCDTAKGTHEALKGIVPALSADGWIFSQDFHIGPVRSMLQDPLTWRTFLKSPNLTIHRNSLVSVRFGS